MPPGPRRLWRWAAAAVTALVVVGGGTAVAAGGGSGAAAVQEQDQVFTMPETPGSASTVRIDTAYFTTGDGTPRPAVLLAHGFGGSKDDMAGEARFLAQHGYRVLTWSARGFGRSTGAIGLDAPDREVADVERLIDWLGKRPDVVRDGPDDPRVGIAGASYGGAISLLTAGHDRRVDAIAPQITWWDLNDALFPGGVFKKLWAGVFFTTGSSGASGCRFTAALCQVYQHAALTGTTDAATTALLAQSSPDSVAASIKVPTLITQGQNDSLFPLAQADAMARAIRANGAPVAVDWSSGGHDGGDQESSRVQARTLAWFDTYLKHDQGVDTGPAFRVTRTGGVSVSAGQVVTFGASADSYPTINGTARRTVALDGPPQTVANPAGGMPPAVSSVPGLGALGQLGGLLGGNVSLSQDMPGQYAAFQSAPLDSALQLTGSADVQVTVDTDGQAPAVLFAKLYDVSPDGSAVLPHQLVTPLRVTASGTVDVRLPAVDHDFAAGHRLRLVLATTDLGFSSPAAPATYRVSLPSGAALTLPTDPALRNDRSSLPLWVWVLPLAAAAIAVAIVATGRGARRRRGPRGPDPELEKLPLVVRGLSKRYQGSTDRYAVKELSFRVERGQVLGLLGPNGAGKTTTMRMLMGLIRPDAGTVHLFGHPVTAGAPVLSRVGAFVEGAGFLPHLSGRANLDLYWRATGRPAGDAHVAEALEIADLGEALERPVRTYSQGMRQRLAIAQAMLGLPELLILDEPTNGLDPQQIREMRAVITRYAAGGRTVIVSSHLLSEVEQTCTHLVVMTQGRLLAAGPVAEITGNDDELLVGIGEMGAEELDAAITAIGTLDGVVSVAPAPEEAGLLVRLDGLAVAQLLAELLRLNVPVERVGPHRRLEDAFLTLTGDRA
ncbi:alpha/beta fold hydrolase [Streptacidiphilus jiangxiensis]|uniref:ABC-2 type transport system ATP-binding protein n=1 Tax=Streptacidiphilus jiangxiensis TaxID=235985 RepID=A0A1H7V6R5_STRJI|nr:alpha/beta fold hydrolase [Streptacidiphilus jiangxiensis]SEM04922.1 ABC-2 type transport system ATP-binding protein [Streptacidiphilus jiangxiensis]